MQEFFGAAGRDRIEFHAAQKVERITCLSRDPFQVQLSDPQTSRNFWVGGGQTQRAAPCSRATG
jgi:hypothetical protein